MFHRPDVFTPLIAWFLILLSLCTSSTVNPDLDSTLSHGNSSSASPSELGSVQEVSYRSCDANAHGTHYTGTCIMHSECLAAGGTEYGYCEGEVDVCCVVTKNCLTDSAYNNTYFSQDYENPSDICSLEILVTRPDVCQVRLDFLSFELEDPDEKGICRREYFTVTGGASTPPTLCGSNTDQHVYVDLDRSEVYRELTLRMYTPSGSSFLIQVTHILCDSTISAPPGCLQYYTGISGTVKSFNFGYTLLGDTRQLASTEYAVCIRAEADYCGIRWQRNESSIMSFTMTNSVDAVDPIFLGTPMVSVTGSHCTTDYVIIPGGLEDTGKAADRFCGLGFPLSVTTSFKPFILYVRTDDDEEADNSNSGFLMDYEQVIIC